MPLYILADNSVIFDELKDSRTGEYANAGTLAFTVYRLLARDGVATAGSATLTTTTSAFVAGDAGRAVVIPGAGANGSDLRTTIATFVSATSVTLTTAPSVTVSRADVRMSLDNAKDIAMAYVAASDGMYLGTIDDAVALKDQAKYWVEVTIDGGSGRKDFRVLEQDAEYRM